MKVTKEIKEHNEVILEITVEKEKFEEAVVKSFNKNKKFITVPGFRKGKAPRALIEKAYGESVFYEDAVDFIFEETYPDAVKESETEPVSRPEIDIKEIGKDKDFVYTAKIYVKPEVKIGDFKGIKIKKPEYPVKDEDIDAEIKNMLERVAHIEDAGNKAIENGDIAVIDYEGFVDDKAFDGGKGENHELTIGSGQFIPGFEEQLVGKKAGDECDVNVTFPEEYHAKDLAGKAAVFKVKINAVKQKEYPALDDEFAKDVSEYETLDELKKATKERLEENAKKREDSELSNSIMEEVIKITEIDVPDAMVQNEIDANLQEMEYNIKSQMPNITLEQYFSYMGMTVQQYRDSMKDNALNRVKSRLILEQVAKDEKIEATESDIDAEIEKMAEQYKMEKEKIKELIGQGGNDGLKEDILSRKAFDLLKEKVTIK